ncbi:MAG TPA: YcgL domain-containing protein, partial [Gammaproteobacteria bacterium]
MSKTTPCYIYRSKKQLEMYLFLAKEDDFECIPEEVLKALGQLEKAMELELTAESKLARSKPEEVI